MKKYSFDEYHAIFLDLWSWLRDNPSQFKDQWPEWHYNRGNIRSLLNCCPACDYTLARKEAVTGKEQDRVVYCEFCPIKKWREAFLKTKKIPCSRSGPFLQWFKAGYDPMDEKTRAKAAEEILSLEWVKEEEQR